MLIVTGVLKGKRAGKVLWVIRPELGNPLPDGGMPVGIFLKNAAVGIASRLLYLVLAADYRDWIGGLTKGILRGAGIKMSGSVPVKVPHGA